MKGRWPSLVLIALLAATALLLQSFETPAAAAPQGLAATYSSGALRVTIPSRALRPGGGRLTVELLNPEDEVLARSERAVAVTAGSPWREQLELAKPLAVNELVWHRLRYRFVYDGAAQPALSDTESVSSILRRPVLRVIGQQQYLAGGAAAARVLVTDTRDNPLTGTVRIELISNGASRPLYSGRLDRRGSLEAQFRLPAGLVGNHQLHYVAETPLGSWELTQPVQLQDKVSILLTTEKPIYQPGQTIHVRALALDRAGHNAAAGRNLTFEIEDSRGNKVFKRSGRTDRFGIAAAEFTLADEVNLGTYHVRAFMDEGNTAELALNVDRYVLPKFKVAVEMTGKTRHGYRPGDRVTGVVRANYFFGKPVEGEVTIKATGMDLAVFEAASARGKTDTSGEYRFDLRLPDYFAGAAISQGSARVLVEATVKDSAGHSESRGEPITVSASNLLITAIPEAGALIPEIENQVYIVVSYPDGKPARADLRVRAHGQVDQSVSSDESGVAVVRVPAVDQPRDLQIEATDRDGLAASVTVPLRSRVGFEHVLLRADRAVYRAGDRIAVKILSTRQRGAVYLDVVKDRQTVLTRDVDLVNGQAELTLTATPELAGTLDLNAYVIGRDSQVVADHRLVFVHPTDELKVETSTDRPVYRPGEDARVEFRVTNARGEGVQAALGVQIVDEAVFALAEKQPGFAKVFFYLEQEALKPRYEIHSFGVRDVVETASGRDRAAQALFAATETVTPARFENVAGRDLPRERQWEFANRYRARLVAAVTAGPVDPAKAKFTDPWGTPVTLTRRGDRFYLMQSAGPDKDLHTQDDLFVPLQTKSNGPYRIDLKVESDRGPENGRAEIAGSVLDGVGVPVAGARITARAVADTVIRGAQSDSSGRFTISAIPAGQYRVEIAPPGSSSVTRDLTLAPRDRALLTVKQTESGPVRFAEVPQGRIRIGGNVAMPMAMARQFDAGRLVVMNAAGVAGVVGGVPGGIVAGSGGVIGGIIGSVPSAAPPPPPAKAEAVKPAAPAARVRSYFPEALYINPALITDGNGHATVSIPLADSITSWRMALTASTVRGALGSASGSIKVFQDFFADLDLPVTLTQGDRVSIPVAVYNYSGNAGNVDLRLEPADWFGLVDDASEKSVAVESGRVGGAQFTLEAKRIGKFKLTLHANLAAARRADIVVREIEVVPDGREQTIAFNGRLESAAGHEIAFPPTAIPDAGKVFVRLYPGALSQVIEGMDAILRMPFGCFEQTSSATYPNVLALDYMKRAKKLTPEIRAKAESFIATGYQRLLTYEVPGGGFSWFGNPPANKILTSYGLMEFSDMAKVFDVDPRVIERTQTWLASQQQPDGGWKPDGAGIAEGATNRYLSDAVRITAYIAWALENTGYRGPALAKARAFLDGRSAAVTDPYTLAVLANFAADYPNDRAYARRAVEQLLAARVDKDDQTWWTTEETAVYGRGPSAAVETTGLAVQALLKSGEASAVARKALNFLASKKNANGDWGTTQATIMALRAILLSTEKGGDVRGTVEITLNGKPVETLTLTSENNELFHQFALKGVDSQGANRVDLRFTGQGTLAYQVAGRYFVPWTAKPPNEPLSIDVAYDRTRLAQDDLATATATVRNNLPQSANMVMVDLGIPPGFDLLSEDLQDMQQKTAGQKGGRLEKFNLTATQAILYFDAIPARDTVTVKFRLRAKYPIRARTFRSRVYEYYDPEVSAVARPIQLEVAKKR